MDQPSPSPCSTRSSQQNEGDAVGCHTRKSLHADEGGRKEKSKLEAEKRA